MTSRLPTDRCPGLLRPYLADDGAIMRLRKPGGRLTADTLLALTNLATSHGAPALHFTSRGNIEARALPVPLPDPLVTAVVELGLLPSASHERVRNVFAHPLNPALAPLVDELDAAICADDRLTELPGRFWFGFTDASGLGLSEPLDIAYQRFNDDDGRLLVEGRSLAVTPANAVDAMIGTAHAFLDTRPASDAWNIRDLPSDSPVFVGMTPVDAVPAPPLLPGTIGDDLVVGLPLGDLTLTQARAIANVASEVVVTPWRALVMPRGAEHAAALATTGLIVDAASPWGRVSACAGAPQCRNTTRPTMQIAAELVKVIDADGPHVHLAGCERHCGASDNERIIYPDTLADALAQLAP